MTESQLRDTIREVIGEIAPEADLARVPDDVDIRRELDLDSLDFLNFVVAMDERLGVRIPEDDYPELTTVGGSVKYLSARA